MTIRSKRVSAFIFILGLAASAIAACGFPDVTFAPDEGAEGGLDATLAPDAPSDGARADGQGAPPNPDVDPEGGSKDATVVDGSGKIDAGPDATCCDCDEDTFKREGGTCALPTGDCDDLNLYVKPNQGFIASTVWDSTHVPIYDWDCNGTTVKQYAHSAGSCSARLKLSGCSAGQAAFEGDPACGVSGHYIVTCAADGNVLNLNCTETAFDNRVQGCH
jgi:hypothetical protein